MKKQILSLGKVLYKTDQKEIYGKGPIEGPDCKCFCYSNGVKVSNSCRQYCPDGTIPGVESGDPSCWTGAEY
ncbi:hypothetical protein [Tenacibaculum caenipelagi]|uniref:Uncharacterized protein n=1 Tax=Tenacibaculum caenipelagi TaxID=1325435 RepID=A0A4R6TE60_9FLAO|nr:hypothetical protein [Tenacibaculum caenipelagi]TDQ23960.1 hypothetical protein DFQ07_2499 [Tenacibaculum caenipelagi]